MRTNRTTLQTPLDRPEQEQSVVAELTVQLLRGVTIADVLHRRPTDPDALMKQWARMVRCQLSSQEENQ